MDIEQKVNDGKNYLEEQWSGHLSEVCWEKNKLL